MHTFAGSQPGEDDVIPFTEVGVVNDVIITGLRLQSGHTYYATIRGIHTYTLSCSLEWSIIDALCIL